MASSGQSRQFSDLEIIVETTQHKQPEDADPEVVTKEHFSHTGPGREVHILEQWNKPRINIYRYLTTLYTFVSMGMNDAAYGVSLRSTCLQSQHI